jgi:hypothetical protein
VGKPHLDLLALAPRLLEALGASERPGDVSGVLMYVARDLARWFLRTALWFERAYIAVELARTIQKRLAFVHGAARSEPLSARAVVDVAGRIISKVAAREGAIVPLRLVVRRNMGRDALLLDQPVQPLSVSSVLAVLPAAVSFTLRGAVESLLSAKVADGITGRKHRYNMEVVAQGIANVASALFGGISVTGTIARTATNIRAGACSPISGMMHALMVLIFMVVASPLASFIPLSTLADVLVVVCWNMAEKEEFLHLLHDWRSASVLIATFGLTLIEDLTVGIIAGCAVAAVIAIFDFATSARRELP